MNVADSEVVASVMGMAGYEVTESQDEADAVFLNTCSVRDNAEQKILSRLDFYHRLQKKQPLAAPNDVKRYFVSPEESGQICMLACILGKGGEVFFPKLGEEQMLTFSTICDDFIKANGLEKDLCTSDEEAKRKAAQLKTLKHLTDSQLSTLNSQLKYPTVYFKSDTTGEKAYEEFYITGEKINMERFKALGVVEETTRRPMEEVNAFFAKLEMLFADDFTKEDVVKAIKEFIPNFEHEEKGKNLDQKM